MGNDEKTTLAPREMLKNVFFAALGGVQASPRGMGNVCWGLVWWLEGMRQKTFVFEKQISSPNVTE